ncbi:MAG: bifunctional precorrin-2 dehydrogenase/sirohydrochlorin ferrochelatase [Desulfovibrio sp.]|nr:bifunctional precorrin-2 dehydrogenase/sirohydrochlorin ferrochelatase [Desulfovibrio sp.]
MPDAELYPLFLSLKDASCVLFGLGAVGRRKLAALIPARPRRLVLAEQGPLAPEASALAGEARAAGIQVDILADMQTDLARPGEVDRLLDDAQIVYACTSDHAFNQAVASACARRRILCNCTDRPEMGSAHVPAQARRGALCAALSTGGASPALARRWKGELEAWLAGKERICALMARARPLVLGLGLGPQRDRDLFRALAEADLEAALAEGRFADARALLEARLPRELGDHIEELLHASATLA